MEINKNDIYNKQNQQRYCYIVLGKCAENKNIDLNNIIIISKCILTDIDKAYRLCETLAQKYNLKIN